MHQETLIAMGGALQLDGAAVKAFFERAGGVNARVVIIPSASSRLESGEETAQGMQRLGFCCPPVVLPIFKRKDANRPQYAELIHQASCVFLGGGNQNRLLATIGGTLVHRALLEAYQQGVVISGTSAGTAALSAVMISHGASGALPCNHMAHLVTGLGFTQQIIFDQHFRQRNRLGRLLYAVTCHPGLTGIGVDEDTAAIIEGNRLTVAGAGTVTILDSSSMRKSEINHRDGSEPVTFSGIQIHSLASGSTFDLNLPTAEVAGQVNEAV